ncbi:hypothetical protein K502DRAFT_367606 [Neoconidiobolus thromboides FSU 785]|nr:hypothetical protein K502DRAFT_367606 [Neoconidiobolus thromboides FSU 785]
MNLSEMNENTDFNYSTLEKVLFVANINGDFTRLESLIKKNKSRAVIHSGSFGFHSAESIKTMSERILRQLISSSTLMNHQRKSMLLSFPSQLLRSEIKIEELSEFPEYLNGNRKFSVPIYTIHGSFENITVLQSLTSTHNIDNLYFIDQQYSPILEIGELKVRFFGLGGAFVRNKLFDHGTGSGYLAGNEDGAWVTLLQIGELIEMSNKIVDTCEIRILLTHTNLNKEPIISQLASKLKIDYVLSPSLEPRLASMGSQSVTAFDNELLKERLEKSREDFIKLWEVVRPHFSGKSKSEQKRIAETAISLLDIIPPPQDLNSFYETPYFDSIIQLTAPNFPFGFVNLNFCGVKVSFETRSHILDYSHKIPKVKNFNIKNNIKELNQAIESSTFNTDTNSIKTETSSKKNNKFKNKINLNQNKSKMENGTNNSNGQSSIIEPTSVQSKKKVGKHNSYTWPDENGNLKPKENQLRNDLETEALNLTLDNNNTSLDNTKKEKLEAKIQDKMNRKLPKSSWSDDGNEQHKMEESKEDKIITKSSWSDNEKVESGDNWEEKKNKSLNSKKWNEVKGGLMESDTTTKVDDWLNKKDNTIGDNNNQSQNNTFEQVDWASKVSEEEAELKENLNKDEQIINGYNIIWVDKQYHDNQPDPSKVLYINNGEQFEMEEPFFNLIDQFKEEITKIIIFKLKTFALIETNSASVVEDMIKILNDKEFKGRRLLATQKRIKPRKGYYNKNYSYSSKGTYQHNKSNYENNSNHSSNNNTNMKPKMKYNFGNNNKYSDSKQQWRDFASNNNKENNL